MKKKLEDFSVLIGGKAGFGIESSSLIIAYILKELGRFIYINRDYPSLIRGGHTFSIIRSANKKISAFSEKIDVLLALNQQTFDLHKDRLKKGALVIYDAKVKAEGVCIDLEKIIKEEKALEVMKNSVVVGAFCKSFGIDFEILNRVYQKHLPGELELNLKVAKRGYDAVATNRRMNLEDSNKDALLSGNEAISLGLIAGGLEAYISYPMTPTSSILHFLAGIADKFNLQVVHPESEISVILMALGFSYVGKRSAVGTSGGGFCLMTEGLSFAAMAELPITIIMGQRTGPSTGLPTYTGQSELNFVLSAGHGDFLRLVVAPGDLEDAYYLSSLALALSHKYQIPALVLTDKMLSESICSFTKEDLKFEIKSSFWDKNGVYKRYQNTETGVSPLAFPSKGIVVKANSYEHDEFGITTEDPKITKMMQEKRLKKEKYLRQDLKKLKTVNVLGQKSSRAILCFGSNKGVCDEIGKKLGMKVVQPLFLNPFPKEELLKAFKGVKKIYSVENNAKGQLADLFAFHGFKIDKRILKYDGRPFSLEELEKELKK